MTTIGDARKCPLLADYCLSARCRKADKMLLLQQYSILLNDRNGDWRRTEAIGHEPTFEDVS